MEKLFQLVYTSFVSLEFDDADLQSIVDRARIKNRRLNVTGLLIFDGLCFCQYLEGEKSSLFSLVNEIRADPRHFEFVVVQQRELNGPRLFEASPLGYAKSHDPDALDVVRKADRSAIALLLHLASSLEIEN